MSFTGVVGLLAAVPALKADLRAPIFALLVSFSGYFVALNMQGYKNYWWVDQLADGFRSTADFSLILAIAYSAVAAGLDDIYTTIVLVVAFGAWLFDMMLRLAFEHEWLEKLRPRVSSVDGERREHTGTQGWVICDNGHKYREGNPSCPVCKPKDMRRHTSQAKV